MGVVRRVEGFREPGVSESPWGHVQQGALGGESAAGLGVGPQLACGLRGVHAWNNCRCLRSEFWAHAGGRDAGLPCAVCVCGGGTSKVILFPSLRQQLS